MKQKLLTKVAGGEMYLVQEDNGSYGVSISGESEFHGFGNILIPLKPSETVVPVGVTPDPAKIEALQKTKEAIVRNGCNAIFNATLPDTSAIIAENVALKMQLEQKTKEAKQFWDNLQERNKLVEEMVKMDEAQNKTLKNQADEITKLKAQLKTSTKKTNPWAR